MNGTPVSKIEIRKIVRLRRTGHSLPEIRKIIHRGNSTVSKYIRNVKVLPEYQSVLKSKQGASKVRALHAWKLSAIEATKLMRGATDKRMKALIAATLYWGEGTKKDFSLSNTDPYLIKIFVECLKSFGVRKRDLRITIRIYEDLDKELVIKYWSGLLDVPRVQILNVNILKGKKKGKLQYGMCRIRVTKGGKYLKLLQSIIQVITAQILRMPS